MAEEGKPKLRPASENIWYVLATIAGEPVAWDELRAQKNLYYWNGLMRDRSTFDERLALQDIGGNSIVLPMLTSDDYENIRNALDARGFKNKQIPGIHKDIDFSKVIFNAVSTFNYFVFIKKINFSEATFPGGGNFLETIFIGKTDFSGATFCCGALFKNAIFISPTNFSDVEFRMGATFHRAVFTEQVDFSNSTFTHHAVFGLTKFIGSSDFRGVTIAGEVEFNKAIFTSGVDFCGVEFKGYTQFQKTIFRGHVNLNHTILETTTDFTETKFYKFPPVFYDAKISESIIWSDTVFPRPPNDLLMATYHKNAYERLSLMMSKLEKPHDKHLFFRLEMLARRKLDIGWSKLPAKTMNWVYDKSCQYGYGFGRALALWVGHIVVGGALVFSFTNHSLANFVNSFAASFSNAHSFLGLNRGPLKGVYEAYSAESWFNALWVVQGILGIMFLFFLILTIRNRFKMG